MGTGVDHLLIQPEFVKRIRHVIMIGDVGFVFGLRAVTLVILADAFQRPRLPARNESESRCCFQSQYFVHGFAKFAAAHLGAGIGHIKKCAVIDVEAFRGPQIAQGDQIGLAYQRGDSTLIGDITGKRGGRIGGRHPCSIPKTKPELQLHPFINMIQHEFEGR